MSGTPNTDIEDISKLLGEITESNLDELSLDEILELRKKLNPYGRTIEGSDNWLTFSFINFQEKYLERLLFTGLVGFLNRAVDEWHVPDGIPVIPVYDYIQNPDKLEEYHQTWKMNDKLQRQIDENRQWMKKRVIVKEFLEEMFQYNPDAHVRSVYKPQPKDLDRAIIETPAANLATEYWKKKEPAFKELMLTYDRVQNLRAMKEAKNEQVDPDIDTLVGHKLLLPSQHYYTMDFSTWTPEDKNLLRNVCTMIPPSDTYKRYRTYFESNYDKLREAVLHLYNEKPDLDIAINPYQWHETEELAIEFQKKHADEVITEVYKAQSGKWNLLAPFEKVRKTMRFFNKNTAVLEEMTKQLEMDQKLGADMVKKRVIKKKRENIKEEGPDAELFTKWKEKNSILKEMGAENPEDDECPADAVQVDVWKVAGGNMVKDKFYTKSEIPDVPSG
jgi:exonuclease VII small subunit